MTTYAPRTLLRLFNDDKTAHTTGVVLKDGSVYDIKFRSTHPSVNEWKSNSLSFTGELTVDTSKAEGVVIPSDWKGFTNSKGYTPHTDWIYCMMLEYTPHLLEREDIKNAFNNYQNVYANMVKNGSINTGSYYIRKGKTALVEPSEYTIPCGYARTSYFKQQMNVIKEIHDAYKPLYDLIKPDLVGPLFERSEIERKKQKETRNKYLIGVFKRRVAKYKKLIVDTEKEIVDTEKVIESLKDSM
jgi:hypothetical protein